MALARGDIVLVPFPFTDLTARKVRPAVIVSPDPQSADVVVAFISSVSLSALARTDWILPSSHPDFALTGLKDELRVPARQALNAPPFPHPEKIGPSRSGHPARAGCQVATSGWSGSVTALVQRLSHRWCHHSGGHRFRLIATSLVWLEALRQQREWLEVGAVQRFFWVVPLLRGGLESFARIGAEGLHRSSG